MVAETLTYQDVCRQAEEVYRTQYDRKAWPPASHAPDVRAPATAFGNVATPVQGSITQAEVMNLIILQTQGASEQGGKKGNCHKCDKPCHWANKCPENANSSRKNHTANSGNRGERAHKQKS